jgi:H+/Cl- antiporter ClcA
MGRVLMDKNNTKNTLFHWYDFKLKIIAQSVVTGFFVGLIIVLYRFLIEKALGFSRMMYLLAHSHLWLIPLYIIILAAVAYFIGWLVEKEPVSSGSGIPQVEGILLGRLHMRWWSVLGAKFIAGILSIGAGLSLGREGPSIQMGAAVGQGTSRIFKNIKVEEKYLLTSGASAGLAAAFNAPISGVIFALEEVHKNFSPTVMISALAASITSDFLSEYFFGMHPIFGFKNVSPLPLMDYGYIIFLGILMGFWGMLFNKSLLTTQDLYAKLTWMPARIKPIIAFLLAGLAGFFLPQVLGGGNDLITAISSAPLPFKLIVIILIVKFLFTMVSYGSSVPGGIFLPLLVIGALSGVVYGNAIHMIFGFNKAYMINMMILAMAGYFTAIVKAPITGIVLITEMTGSFNHLLAIAAVSMTAYIVVSIMGSHPIYETLLHRILAKNGSPVETSSASKSLIEASVCCGSAIDGRLVKEIKWPLRCLLVSIQRGMEEIIPKGDTRIYPGDYLIILADEDMAAETREGILKIAEDGHRHLVK